MKSTVAAAGLRHHRAEAVAVVKEEAPAVERGRSGSSTICSSPTSRLLEQVPAKKEAAEPINKQRLLERKSTEDINQSAEAFINKFRHQLLLQRLESIENYEQMLRRGT